MSAATSHRFDPTILREYDIRGVIGKTLSAEDAYAILSGSGRARLNSILDRSAGMCPPAPDLAPVGGRGGTLGSAGPDTPGGFMRFGPRRGGPTLYFKIFQFHPLVVHSSV